MPETGDKLLDLLLACGAALDESPKVPPREWKPAANLPPADAASRPGSDFNRRGDWSDLLTREGWRLDHERGGVSYWTRPGKKAGVSASLGHCKTADGLPRLRVFSTSARPFDTDTTYDLFGAYTLLKHGGDASAAARQLAADGYGEQTPTLEVNFTGTSRAADPPAAENFRVHIPDGMKPVGDKERPFLWASELRFREKSDKWLWEGYLNRGGMTLFTALWKSGKSTLLAHLVRAFGNPDPGEFCGLPIRPARVLYVTEEDEQTWAERRDALGYGDHVGFVCRPFMGRANREQWERFIDLLSSAVEEYGFDVVIFDTVSKLWPVREENDAGDVENALMPLWKLTGLGVALLIVHHTRKSDGKEFTAGRGSGGLPAFAETLVELRRHNPDDRRCRKRRLTGGGRYPETKLEWLIELTDAGYIGLGDYEEADAGPLAPLPAVIAEMCRARPLTADEIAAGLKGRGRETQRQELLRELKYQSESPAGTLAAVGRGIKGEPKKFSPRQNANSVPAVPPLGIAREPHLGTESVA